MSADDTVIHGSDIPDVHARQLIHKLASMPERFVMIIDANLRIRRVYSYDKGSRLLSPLDFVGWVVAMRQREWLPQAAGIAGENRCLWPWLDCRARTVSSGSPVSV